MNYKTRNKNNIINDKLNSRINDNHIQEYMYTSFSENILYLYDKNLNIHQKEAPFIWLNNEEKDTYLKDLINELIKYTNVSIENGEIRLNQSTLENILLKCNTGIEIYRKKTKLKEFMKLLATRLSYYIKQYDVAIIGKEGEEYVNNHLNLYDNFYNLSNVRFELNDLSGEKQSVESDNIIISKYGVYILEVKNLSKNGSYDIIIERDGRWLKKYKNGKVVSMKNATEQNNRHIVYLNKLINIALNRKMDNYIEAEGVVIIANDTVNIYNNSQNQKVFRLAEFYPFLKNQNTVLNQQEMDLIKDIIIKNQLPPSKFPIYDYRFEIKNNYDDFFEYIQMEDYTAGIVAEDVNSI